MFRYLRQRQLHIFSFAAFGHLATSFDYSHLTILSSCVYYLHCGQDNKAFLYGDVSSNNDLNQLMFIIKNNGLFMWNDAAKQYKQMWWKVTENRLGRVEIGHKNMTYDRTWAKQAMVLQQIAPYIFVNFFLKLYRVSPRARARVNPCTDTSKPAGFGFPQLTPISSHRWLIIFE